MTVKRTSIQDAFSPPLGARLAEGARALRLLFQRLPAPVALRATVWAAANSLPLCTRIRQSASVPLTRQLAAVDQAIAWAAAIYRALLPSIGHERALSTVDDVVLAAGIRLMRRAFPPLEGPDVLSQLERFLIPALRYAERHGLYQLGSIQRDPDRLSFEITRCHYEASCRALGLPELAHSFCNVDKPFFASLGRQVELTCPGQLTAGDPACTFVFSSPHLSSPPTRPTGLPLSPAGGEP